MELTKIIDGKKYRYLKIGTGSKKLLFLYGLSSFKECTLRLVSGKSFSRYTVIVPEYPYHNNFADADVAVDSVKDVAEYILPILHEENIYELDAIGFSFGGLVLLEMLSKVDSGVAFKDVVIWASPIVANEGLSDTIKPISDIYLKVSETHLERIHKSPLLCRTLLSKDVKPIPALWLKRYLNAIKTFRMPSLKASTNYLFIYDPADLLVSGRNLKYLRESVRGDNVAVVEIKGGGHFGTKDGWTKALNRINKFLNPGMSTTDPDSR